MKTQSKSDIFEKIQKNRKKMSEYGIIRIGLFGSYIRNEQTKKSDIDLLVQFAKEKKTFQNYIKFINFIERLLGKRIEVITPESISPYIAPYIYREVKYVQIAI